MLTWQRVLLSLYILFFNVLWNDKKKIFDPKKNMTTFDQNENLTLFIFFYNRSTPPTCNFNTIIKLLSTTTPVLLLHGMSVFSFIFSLLGMSFLVLFLWCSLLLFLFFFRCLCICCIFFLFKINILFKIAAGESFSCPAHRCFICKEPKVVDVYELQFAICRRCLKHITGNACLGTTSEFWTALLKLIYKVAFVWCVCFHLQGFCFSTSEWWK